MTDGQAHALAPVCSGGSLQLSVDVPRSGLSRWRIDGAARFMLQSCDGDDAPLVPVDGTKGTGELIAPVASGSYFVNAAVDAGGTPSLSAAVTEGEGLSWSDCAAAPVLPDDLSALSSLTVFYPSSGAPQYTSFATGTTRGGLLLLDSTDPSASASLCASCDTSTCAATTAAAQGLPTYGIQPGGVLAVPAGAAAVTATFTW
jgi:hypothetical protein